MRKPVVLCAASFAAALILGGVAARASDRATTADTRWTLQRLPFSSGAAINDRGVVAGATLSEKWRSFVFEGGRLRDLGTLGGDETELLTAETPLTRPERGADVINNRGQVVGRSTTRDGRHHAFRWQNGRMVDLGTNSGIADQVVAVNERGQVIGSRGRRGFVWSGGRMRAVGFGRSAVDVNAVAINDRGQVIFQIERRVRPYYRGFLWANGRARNIGSLGGPYTFPLAINNRGQIAGHSSTRRAPNDTQVFLWQNGRMRDLGDWGVRDINERGQIVGFRQTTGGGYRAVLWQNGRLRDLGVLPGDRESLAIAINDRGQIIGVSFDSRFHYGEEIEGSRPFVWERGRIRALPGLRAREEGTVTAINNRGEILGAIGGRGAVVWRPRR